MENQPLKLTLASTTPSELEALQDAGFDSYFVLHTKEKKKKTIKKPCAPTGGQKLHIRNLVQCPKERGFFFFFLTLAWNVKYLWLTTSG